MIALLLGCLLCLINCHNTQLPDGFSYLHQVEPTIIIQTRYATPDNFRGQVVKGYLKQTAIIGTQAALALKQAQRMVKQLGYSLVFYDGYRPQKSSDDFMQWAAQPQDNKTKQQFYPYIDKSNIVPDYLAAKSGHTRGSTVDLTIIRLDRQIHEIQLIDYQLRDGRTIKIRDDGSEFMCGHFDLFDVSSHHDTMLIAEDCLQKRNILRSVMLKCSFRQLHEEWWHYTLLNQPFPSTYFNFDIE